MDHYRTNSNSLQVHTRSYLDESYDWNLSLGILLGLTRSLIIFFYVIQNFTLVATKMTSLISAFRSLRNAVPIRLHSK
jgi:hypothetical protein